MTRVNVTHELRRSIYWDFEIVCTEGFRRSPFGEAAPHHFSASSIQSV
jgi:hypothetical protein